MDGGGTFQGSLRRGARKSFASPSNCGILAATKSWFRSTSPPARPQRGALMGNQQIPKPSSLWNRTSQEKSSQFAPRPFAVQARQKPAPGRSAPAGVAQRVTVESNAGVVQRVNAGRLDDPYDSDILTGGDLTVRVSLARLLELWDPQQRDQNVHAPAVEEYAGLLGAENGHVEAPFLDSINLNEDGDGVIIRTSEGRHRIHAANQLHFAYIYILRPSDQALALLEAMGIDDLIA